MYSSFITNHRSFQALSTIQKTLVQAQFLSKGLICVKNNPLTLEDINTFKMLKMPEGDHAKCFAACLFKNIGILDDMGKLTSSGARQSAKQVFANDESSLSKVENIVQECAKVNDEEVKDGDKGCERAALAFACLTQVGPKYGLDLQF
uniref:Odorant Binding Protein n=1 Tax=Epiphyas postvittana TaxID=65032 RepID=A0A0K8TUB0_EPIPO